MGLYMVHTLLSSTECSVWFFMLCFWFPVGSRSMFTSSKPDFTNPSWFRVGLAFGSSVFIWGLLFKQHSTDVHEYKVRNGLE
ncbi:NADH dehydrogenase [ubiquinone] 1 subunit C1, mitochondrial isoform X1 [Morone saxatilis]|uniref:NADH dehydrogenase [ubiquinone] 1 subunit C1, mitochondrial isoform X1 n=1 Tax=Morone saxatilis TaxID=34816 RepID=UPI0015E231E7|nr:NADH dehydrogenase [ubiquinone] 1 subunit C1, mitochondrial isoform X1 [Morone saxatilis]XP_035525855.1 NADH dehydrogenase [ubiquinone] 1 subunit C1, mitochondrial isoform X1 [Morone saxatilis]